MEPTEIAKVLEDAADELLVRGHAKGSYESDGGRVCALGAIRVAVSGDAYFLGCEDLGVFTRADFAGQALADHLGFAYSAQIAEWNDRDERTEDEVRDALLMTAKHLRNGEQ